MNISYYYKGFFLFLIIFIQSCQTVETINEIVFDYSQFENITFTSNVIEIKDNYFPTFQEPNLDHIVTISPSSRLQSWLKSNVKNFGVENMLIISIEDASIIKSEIDSNEKIGGIIKKPKENKFEIKYEIEYIVYSDTDKILGKTKVKVNRSTTSPISISLDERDQILDNLIYNALRDLSSKSKDSVKKHLKGFIL